MVASQAHRHPRDGPSLNLYGLERSVYTRIARLALEEKGVVYRLHEVEIFGPDGVPIDHLKRHPFGRIPVLEHVGFCLYETSAITRYVDEAFRGPSLQPLSAPARARVNQIIGVLDAYAYRPMVWGVFVERILTPRSGRTANEATIANALGESARCLAALVRIADCAPHLVGDRPTLADLHAFPIIRYLTLAPEGRDLLREYPALEQWLAMMSMRPSALNTLGRYERESGMGA